MSSSVGGSLHGGQLTFDLYVGNLPGDTSEHMLKDLFSSFGNIHSVKLVDSRKNDGLKVGFVRYLEEGDANKASMDMRNYEIGSQRLFVKRTKKPDGGGMGEPVGRKFGSSQPDIVPNHMPGIKPPTPQVIKKEQLMVTHVEEPTKFWAQVVDDTNQVEELMRISEDLTQVCPSAQSITEKPQENKIYGCLFTQDQAWYRCRVMKHVTDTESEVQYIDFGNKEVVQNKTIVELPQTLVNHRPYAQCYTLYGLKSTCEDPTSMGFTQGIETLRKMTESGIVAASVYGAKSIGAIPVVLESDGVDINQEMLNQKYAERRQPRPKQNQERFTPNQQGPPPQGQGMRRPQMNTGPQMNPVLGQGDPPVAINNWSSVMPPLEQRVETRQPPPPMMGQGRPPSGFGQQMPVRPFGAPEPMTSGPPPMDGMAEISRLKQELSQTQADLRAYQDKMVYMGDKYQRENEYLKGERERAIIELAATRERTKALENDINILRDQLADANLSQKLGKLLVNLDQVKLFRSQFPTNTDTRDVIEESIALTSDDPKRVSLEGLDVIQKLEAALDSYRLAQDNIKSCRASDELAGLVPDRDAARVHLHAELQKFIEVVSQLPLEARCADIEGLVGMLEQNYSSFLRVQIPSDIQWSDAMQLYKDWKVRKCNEFQDVRTVTNTCHNALNSALQQLQQQLSLDGKTMRELPTTLTNLDSLLTNLQTATKKEIEITDMERSSDCTTVAAVVHFLMRTLRSELKDIHYLKHQLVEHRDLWMQLKPWLTEKPDVTQVQSIRKNIKALKSKLRHRLADKQDLEEGESEDEDALKNVNKELAEIRQQLQTAFIQDDQCLSELADLHDNHFPELSLLHADLSIEVEGETSGLLKSGRALDQFDLVPMAGKKSVMTSVHCGRPVIIKEFIVDESVGVRKNEFIQRAVAYNSITHPNVLPLEAIFFDKGEKHAYVMMSKQEVNLETMATTSRMSDQAVKDVLHGILKGLQALHEARLTHGSVHPGNVLVTETGEGVLAEYDFTKAAKQRAENKYSAPSGFVFMSQEACVGAEITRSSDIFSFGLLVLWSHFPGVSFAVGSNFIPDFSGVQMNDTLRKLLCETLSSEPARRPTAAQLLDTYFTEPQPEATSVQQSRPEPGDLAPLPVKVSNTESAVPSDLSPTSDGRALKGILKPAGDSPERTDISVAKSVAFSEHIQETKLQLEAGQEDIAALEAAHIAQAQQLLAEVELEQNLQLTQLEITTQEENLVPSQTADTAANAESDMPTLDTEDETKEDEASHRLLAADMRALIEAETNLTSDEFEEAVDEFEEADTGVGAATVDAGSA